MITRTPIGPGWDTLTPGQTIRVGFQEFALIDSLLHPVEREQR